MYASNSFDFDGRCGLGSGGLLEQAETRGSAD
jgi:hypothetical protein